jgi:hypothetical integral membrane protein (TIGR02206 family)
VLARLVLLDWPLADALPLHLCGVAAYLTAAVLLTNSRRLFGVVYFWAVGGTLLALVTPDLPVPLPEPMALGFFASHGLVLVGVAHAAFGLGLRPRRRDVLASWLWLHAGAAVLLPLNLALGTNHLYLLKKPPGPTLLDHLGPWPWYLASCSAIALAQNLAWQAPWEMAARRAGSRGRGRPATVGSGVPPGGA